MEPTVFALPFGVVLVEGLLNQIEIQTNVTGFRDGNGTPLAFQFCYIWDCTLPAATNLANMKAGVVAEAATVFNVNLLTNNVNILMAVT